MNTVRQTRATCGLPFLWSEALWLHLLPEVQQNATRLAMLGAGHRPTAGRHEGKSDMRRNTLGTSVMLAGILLLPLLIVVAQETTSLLIEGPQGQTRVIQVQGKNYVEVDEVARITGGSLRFAGNQIILTLPDSDTPPQATKSPPDPPPRPSHP